MVKEERRREEERFWMREELLEKVSNAIVDVGDVVVGSWDRRNHTEFLDD